MGLDAPLPRTVAVGRGTALFISGWCFDSRSAVGELSLLVNGQVQPLLAYGTPRRDVRAAHDSEELSEFSLRSGFWGFATMSEGAERCELELRARLEDGRVEQTPLAAIPVVRLPAPLQVAEPAPGSEPLVAICMATYEPPVELFERQIASIRAQHYANWVCIVSDDCSSSASYEAIERALGDDPRFVLARSPRRQGFYLNFERALALAPDTAQFVALADQDDSWHPGKLSELLAAIGGAELVYSDARVVDPAGALISETYWKERRNNHEDLLSLLVANSVTGAASLFPRELLSLALPFPPAQFSHYHDHWLALVARAVGDITFVPRPLYDYVQHGDASLGHAAANRMHGLGARLASARRDPRERVRKWRRHYFVDGCRLLQFAAVLDMRCGSHMTAAKRRQLRRLSRAETSGLPLIRLAGRGAREMVGRPETLGAEWMLMYAFAWRRLVAAGQRLLPDPSRLDSVPPPALAPLPDRAGVSSTPAAPLAEKIAPLRLAVDERAPARVNLLIPTVDLHHLFGGYIAKFNLARRLASHGQRVRIVTVDPVGPLPGTWRERIESFSGLAGLFDDVEVEFGREQTGLEVSPADRFIATTWWTAHIAAAAADTLAPQGSPRFLYLIQEYEPFTFPMGSYAALARESYTFAHYALFSTELLRDYFRAHAIGVYASGSADGDQRSLAFENAITAVDPPSAAQLVTRTPRRLLFYARPEPHAARNMFELGLLALARAAQRGAFRGGWQLAGIGSLGGARDLPLAEGLTLELLPRLDQRRYGELLRSHDVGLALMCTPHPSLVPIEMAAAGMLTVTNSFETKTPERLGAISSNLLAVPAGVETLADALVQATAGVDDAERRIQGAAVRWSRDWDESFDETMLARVISFLQRCL